MTIRSRSRGGFSVSETLTQETYRTYCAHTSWTPVGTPVPIKGGVYEQMTDTVVENFAERRAAGELFFNHMSYARLASNGSGTGYHSNSLANTCTSPVFTGEERGNGNWGYYFLPKSVQYGLSTPAIRYLVTPEMERDLRSEVSTEMLSQRGRADSNLYESLAEIDKTLGLFDRPISRLNQTFNRAAQARRQGRFTGYTVDGISHLWLAYRYGIVPLINDIQGIIDGLKKETAKRRQTTRVKKSFELTSVIPSDMVLSPNITFYCNNTVTDSITVRAMSLDEISTSLWENIGFTPKGLATVPWELVRYSFVADWFVNIGDFIGAIIPAPGWKQLGSCLVTIRGTINKYQWSGGFDTSTGWRLDTFPHGEWQTHLLTKTRGPVSFPDLVIKSDFRFDRPKRVADALALLAQRGNRLFR